MDLILTEDVYVGDVHPEGHDAVSNACAPRGTCAILHEHKLVPYFNPNGQVEPGLAVTMRCFRWDVLVVPITAIRKL